MLPLPTDLAADWFDRGRPVFLGTYAEAAEIVARGTPVVETVPALVEKPSNEPTLFSSAGVAA